MSNWFQSHPATTIIGHTILVAVTTWGVSSFILDENKINYYKAQNETANSQIKNEQTITSQYKAKVSILESEIKQLRQENARYLAWLNQEPKSIPAMENKIIELESQLLSIKKENSSISDTNKEGDAVITEPYEYSSTFVKGESFVDPLTKAVVGISDINPDNTAYGVVNIPGVDSIKLSRAKPGTSWDFSYSGSNYKLVIKSVNWLNNTASVSIFEL
ncbi:hypothetical protein VME0621_03620 [Vibrio mediterranei]|uniref:hypothetical protein n=1 Tax=Vibrio mediterranei TaxID=689 RepID=UPI000782B3AB|nr:hypothetical protein [Vibrio mediterranei]SBO11484.1 hypothetical protein VME0621_03620 [Vibrio mediterranei]